MNAIQANKLTKKYGNKKAVNNVSLTIPQGSIYGFLGPNGAGKSTTVKMLITLLSPNGGSATIFGKNIVADLHEVRLLIGVALQEASLDEQQTGRELLQTQGELYGLNKSQINQRVDELEPLIDIGADLDKRIKTYSGGMKRRVDLAAALIHKPKVLFLDEPTTGLDPTSRKKVWNEIRSLNKNEGMTIFLTTQYLEEADALADKIGIINNGIIVAEDTPISLKQQLGNDVVRVQLSKKPTNIKSYSDLRDITDAKIEGDVLSLFAKNGGKVVASIVEQLAKDKIEIIDFEIRKPTLDDVFLSVTETK